MRVALVRVAGNPWRNRCRWLRLRARALANCTERALRRIWPPVPPRRECCGVDGEVDLLALLEQRVENVLEKNNSLQIYNRLQTENRFTIGSTDAAREKQQRA